MRYITDEEGQKQGERIAELLQLREARDPRDGKKYSPKRYKTTWGNKTAIGIYNTIRVLVQTIDDGKDIAP